jgi:hypothetical protein
MREELLASWRGDLGGTESGRAEEPREAGSGAQLSLRRGSAEATARNAMSRKHRGRRRRDN